MRALFKTGLILFLSFNAYSFVCKGSKKQMISEVLKWEVFKNNQSCAKKVKFKYILKRNDTPGENIKQNLVRTDLSLIKILKIKKNRSNNIHQVRASFYDLNKRKRIVEDLEVIIYPLKKHQKKYGCALSVSYLKNYYVSDSCK